VELSFLLLPWKSYLSSFSSICTSFRKPSLAMLGLIHPDHSVLVKEACSSQMTLSHAFALSMSMRPC
jgi:hypothetical protein